MSEFKIDGSTVISQDPVCEYQPPPAYGWQGNGRRIDGPYESWRLSWAYMTDSEFSILRGKVESAAGNRRSVTIPWGSSASWELQSADLQFISFGRSFRGYVYGVILQLNRVST